MLEYFYSMGGSVIAAWLEGCVFRCAPILADLANEENQ